jgi:hypothetical protein
VEPVLPVVGMQVDVVGVNPADGMTVDVDEPIPGDALPVDVENAIPVDAMQVDDQEEHEWKSQNVIYDKRRLKEAESYGLRLMNEKDEMPPALKRRILEFGPNVLIRPGKRDRKPDDSLRDCLEWTIAVDPNMGTFLVCTCPWTGNEYWIGFGAGERIGFLLDQISAIQKDIGDKAVLADVVLTRKREFNELVDAYFDAPADTPTSREAFLKSQRAKTAVLKAIAAETARLTVSRQKEIDVLRRKIEKMKQTLHYIGCEFLSAWSLVLIPRFGLKSVIKCGGGHEMGDKQKAILSHLAHCEFLNRLHTTAAKHKCDVVEVGEAGSSQNCSHCNSKNSPKFERFYHCRNCKLKMTRDGNAAMNIFKMALATILMRFNLRDPYPDADFMDEGEESDSEEEEDDSEEEDERGWVRSEMEARREIRGGMGGSRDKDDDVGDEVGAGGSRVVGSDSMNDHGLLLPINILPEGQRLRSGNNKRKR